jgi:hypothetical protein
MQSEHAHGRRSPVKEPTNDDERLSALLDGRLDGRQREEMLARLSVSGDDRRVFTATAAILRELEEGGEETDTVPDVANSRSAAARRRWNTPAGWGALAAVLAAVFLVSVLASRGRAAAPGDPVRLAALLEPGTGLPEGWTERPRWDATRGGTDAPGKREARAVRAGALLVNLAVAVEARDTAKTRIIAEQVRGRFDPRAGRTDPLRQLSALAGAPPDSLRPLVARATERLSGRLGKDFLGLGAWVEAARLAAHQRNEAFFRTGASGAMLERAERLTARTPVAHAATGRVRATIPAEELPDWAALSGALDTLLHLLAD